MELCLRHNDPTQTLLMTPDGIVMYQITTPTHQLEGATTISRLENQCIVQSSGRVSTVVGQIDYHGVNGIRLRILDPECSLDFALVSNIVSQGEEDRSWTFNGPDSQSYTWQIMFRSPVLFVSGNTLIPLARYRRAKMGIVSRSRRAFLEIFPAGINIIDLVVVTFVSYYKQCMADETEHGCPTSES
ncbi:hypothetical protein BV22DRAFT_494105 [Leucogyrophana mollusca]|uniref:Uncharacterized protein n=1 Tax=Leucogyrophana mollusca TaxID=85980 RepID=A0ACB8BJE8_9AGAM|nr:hypothetical protein BV22DRAFT_494105 [Leucogyrophana mollusca]